MKKRQTFFAILLNILSLAFIAFVVIMQQNFNNPEFTDIPTAETNASDNDGDNDEETDSVAGAAGSVLNENDDTEEVEEDSTDAEITLSTRTVVAETLNARTGPGIDYEIAGLLVQGQEVQVEDNGDKWVKVITDEFEGYVNEEYLSEE
ncbi:SH3 domain-containing protein [Oceanobacillus luteolus]|uniref:SH3 domain-containing protein n=1 Tax=Oceanobacillus luteolus TaxID=1274358 RepID=A0ABW4HQL0_9BACI